MGAPTATAVSSTELGPAMAADSPHALAVLSDLLTSNGDPWGDLIALRLRDDDATRVLREHCESLCGDFTKTELFFEYGVVARVVLRGDGPQLIRKLEKLIALRTTGRIEELVLDGPVDAKHLAKVRAWNPPLLYSLRLRGKVVGLETLALPRLARLDLEVSNPVAPLLEAKLPALRVLRFKTPSALPLPAVHALLGSKLITQLTRLDFDGGRLTNQTLSDAGVLALLEHPKALKGLKSCWVELAGRGLTEPQRAAVKALLGPRLARGMKAVGADLTDDRRFDPWEPPKSIW
jgi:hypothetical protein